MTRKGKLLVLLTSVMTIALFSSNLAATKIWNLFGIPVDGGIIIFPLTYVVGDLMAEFYGRRRADKICLLVTVINLAIMLMMMIVTILPDYPLIDNSAFASVVGFSFRITLASLTAFLLSRWTNNWSFAKIKRYQVAGREIEAIQVLSSSHRDATQPARRKHVIYANEKVARILSSDTRVDIDALAESDVVVVKHYRFRELMSSLIGRLVDNVVFETLAFIGVLPMKDFFVQAGMAYVEGLVVESLLILLISKPLVNLCRTYINADS